VRVMLRTWNQQKTLAAVEARGRYTFAVPAVQRTPDVPQGFSQLVWQAQ
jgi:hypothetical protein